MNFRILYFILLLGGMFVGCSDEKVDSGLPTEDDGTGNVEKKEKYTFFLSTSGR